MDKLYLLWGLKVGKHNIISLSLNAFTHIYNMKALQKVHRKRELKVYFGAKIL